MNPWFRKPALVLGLALILGDFSVLSGFAEEPPLAGKGLAISSAPASIPTTEKNLRPGLDLVDVVQATLRGNPDVLLQKQEIESSNGAVVRARGAFQPVVRNTLTRDHELRPLTKSDSDALGGRGFLPVKTTNYRIAYQRLLRNGSTLSPELNFSRTDSDIPASDPENRAEVRFSMLHPLARGRGMDAPVVKLEEAARLDLQADLCTLRAAVHQALSQALAAYWNYLGNSRRLEILLTAEERAKLLALQTAELIKADITPASEQSQVEANLAAKMAERISGENQIRQDRRSLGLLLGLPAEEIEALAVPVASFPDVRPEFMERLASSSDSLIQTALTFRPDLAGVRLRRQSAAKRTAGARNQERPQVDLGISIGYSGLDQNSRFSSYVSPFTKNVPGLNAVVQVQSELPLHNFTARGARKQSEATEAKLGILDDQTVRNIRSGVALAMVSVIDSLRQRECAALSVASYRTAVENEKAKLAQGMTTIINLISLEDRLTSALLAHIQSQVALARALVSLRYETGLITVPDGNEFAVDVPSLAAFALPSEDSFTSSDPVAPGMNSRIDANIR